MPTVANKRLQHIYPKSLRWFRQEPDKILWQGPLRDFQTRTSRRISQDRDRRTFYRIIQRSSKILVRQEPERASRMIHTSTSSTTFTMTSAGPPQKGPLNAMTSGNILRGRCYNHRITATTAIQHAPSDERVASAMSKWAQCHNQSNLTRTEWREGWVSHIKCAPRRNESDPTRAKHTRVMQANGSISLNIAAGAAKTEGWICENRCFYWMQTTLSSGPPKKCAFWNVEVPQIVIVLATQIEVWPHRSVAPMPVHILAADREPCACGTDGTAPGKMSFWPECRLSCAWRAKCTC